jgi:hypothetical protein
MKLLLTLITSLALSFSVYASGAKGTAEEIKKPEGATAKVAPAEKKVEMPKNIHRPEKKDKKEVDKNKKDTGKKEEAKK